MFAQNFLTISFSFWSSLHAQNVPARNNIMLPTTTPRKTKVNSLFGSSWCTSETIPNVRFAVMFMTKWSVHVALSGLVQQYRSKFYILRLFQKLIAWLHSCSFHHTVEPPIKTTRKLSPFLSDQFSKTPEVSKSNHYSYIGNLLCATVTVTVTTFRARSLKCSFVFTSRRKRPLDR